MPNPIFPTIDTTGAISTPSTTHWLSNNYRRRLDLGPLYAGFSIRRTEPVGLVFLGSSTVEGSDQAAGDRWVNKLLARIQAGLPGAGRSAMGTLDTAKNTAVGIHGYNGGLSGTTSINYLTDTKVSQIGALDPRFILHMVGSNDYKNGISPTDYKNNMIAWLDKLDAAVTRPHVHALAHGQERTDGPFTYNYDLYKLALKELAEDRDNCVFVDTAPYFKQAGNTGTDPLDLMKADNVHLTVNGHEMMFRIWEKELSIPAPSGSGNLIQHVLMSDDFNSGNIADINGQYLNGNLGGRTSEFSWTCDPVGHVGRQNGLMVRQTATAAFVCATRPWNPNMEMSFTMQTVPTGDVLYVVGRRAAATVANSPDDYRLSVFPDGSLTLQKRVAGTVTTLATAPAGACNNLDKVAFRFYQTNIKVIINQEVVIEVTDTSIQSSGWFGFSGVATTTGWEVDDLVIAGTVN